MRLLHICQPTDGGAAVVVHQLAEAGVSAGDDVTVACPAGNQLSSWVVAAGARWVDVAMTRAPGTGDLPHLLTLRNLLPQFETVHAHSSKAGALTRIAVATLRPARRPRVVFTPHGWSWYVGGRAAAAYRWFERWAARRTDVVTVVSEAERADGRDVLGQRAVLELVENGVDTDSFCPDGEVASRTEAPLVVQVGRLSVQKAQDRSIRALALLQDRRTRLRLVGDGPAADELHELARELGVADRVEFAGMCDPRPQLRAADIVVLPSRWEGMSLALLEAMSTGCAVLSSDCGGSDALGSSGELIAHGDDDRAVSELVAHLDRLTADPDQRAALGRAARERAVEHYGLSRVFAGYSKLWRTTHGLVPQKRSPVIIS